MKVVGDIAIAVGADIGPLRSGLRKAGGEVEDFGARAARIGKNIALISAGMSAAFGAVSVALAGTAGKVIEVSTEIAQLSRTAGVNAERFQTLAYAASKYGIEQEKLSDILKDVNDKIGDFMQTGAGPLADFFENIAPKVGVTAEEFRGLSSADALGLYVQTLERANVSQAEMTFFLEAIASDATRLAPLFLDNAAALGEFEQAARDLGIVIDGDLIDKSQRMGQAWDTLMTAMQARFISFAATVMNGFDAIFGLTDEGQLSIGNDQISRLADERGRVLSDLEAARRRDEVSASASASVRAMRKDTSQVPYLEAHLQAVEEEMNLENEKLLKIQESMLKREEAMARLNALTSGGGDGDGTKPSSGSGGGKSDLDRGREEFARFQEGLASEAEALQIHYEEKLAALEEFRARELATEAEYKDAKLRIEEEYHEGVAALDRKAREAKMQALSGVFGDLSSLMQTENKKLFAIGKAAAIADATITGYQAAVEAWEKGMKIGGPPVAAAFTAASLAKTGAMISSIASQQIGGGGGGGAAAGAGGSSGASAAPQQAGTYFNVTMTGGDNFSRDSVRGLISMINEEIDNGAIIKGVRVS